MQPSNFVGTTSNLHRRLSLLVLVVVAYFLSFFLVFSGIIKTAGSSWVICDMKIDREAEFNKDEVFTDSDGESSGLMVS